MAANGGLGFGATWLGGGGGGGGRGAPHIKYLRPRARSRERSATPVTLVRSELKSTVERIYTLTTLRGLIGYTRRTGWNRLR